MWLIGKKGQVDSRSSLPRRHALVDAQMCARLPRKLPVLDGMLKQPSYLLEPVTSISSASCYYCGVQVLWLRWLAWTLRPNDAQGDVAHIHSRRSLWRAGRAFHEPPDVLPSVLGHTLLEAQVHSIINAVPVQCAACHWEQCHPQRDPNPLEKGACMDKRHSFFNPQIL